MIVYIYFKMPWSLENYFLYAFHEYTIFLSVLFLDLPPVCPVSVSLSPPPPFLHYLHTQRPRTPIPLFLEKKIIFKDRVAIGYKVIGEELFLLTCDLCKYQV